MLEDKKIFSWEKIIIIGLSIIVNILVFERAAYLNYCRIFVVCLTILLSLMIVFIIRQRMDERVFWLVNILAIGQAMKSVMVLSFWYVNYLNQVMPVDELTLWSQQCLVDLVSILIGVHIFWAKLEDLQNTYFIIMTFILACLVGLVLNRTIMCSFIKITECTVLLSASYLLCRNKYFQKDIVKYDVPHFEIYILMVCCQYLFVIVLKLKTGKYYVHPYLFNCIQVIILIIGSYHVSLKKPWREKIKAVETAMDQLDEQNRYCEDIINLSHELKTPVNVIRSALTILSMDFDEEDILEDMMSVKKYCQDTMNIIQDMIDIQKLRNHYIQLDVKNYNLVEVFENVIDAFGAEAYDGRLIYDPTDEEIYNLVDKDIFQQGFMLLLGLMLEDENNKKILITLNEDKERQEIVVSITAPSAAAMRERFKEIEHISEKIAEPIEERLTMQLVYIILCIHKGRVEQAKDQPSDQLCFRFLQISEGKGCWPNDDNRQVVQEKIHCRYKMS